METFVYITSQSWGATYVDELKTTLTESQIRKLFYNWLVLEKNDVFPERTVIGLMFVYSAGKREV